MDGGTRTGRGTAARAARLVGALLERLTAVAVLATVLTALAIEVAERSGLLADAVRSALGELVPGGAFEVARCRLDLAGPSVVLEGLTWSDDEGPLLSTGRVEVTLTPLGLGAPRLERVTLRGGEVTVGERLLTALRATGGGATGGGGDGPAPLAWCADRARVEVQGLVLRAEGLADELARVDLVLDRVDGSELVLEASARDRTGATGLVRGRGRSYADGETVVDVAADALPLAPLEQLLTAFEARPTGALRLSARARGRGLVPDSVVATFAVEGAAVDSPRPTFQVDDARLMGRVEWRPEDGGLGRLDGRARGTATWAGREVRVAWRGGDESPYGDVAVHVPSSPVDEAVQGVVRLAVPGEERTVDQTFTALAPRGASPIWLGLRVREADPAPRGTTGLTSDLALVGLPDGGVSLSIEGWPDGRGGLAGFPLRTSGLTGTVAYGHVGDAVRRDRLAIVGVGGEAGGGRVDVDGWLASPLPPYARGDRPEDRRAHLRFSARARDVAVDDALVSAVAATGSGVDLEALIAPRGGRATARVELEQRPSLDGLVVAVDAELVGVTGHYRDLDLPFEETNGEVRVRMGARSGEFGTRAGGARRSVGVSVSARGRVAARPASQVAVEGALRTADPLDPAAALEDTLSQWVVRARGVALDDPLVSPWVEARDELSTAVREAELAGELTVEYRSVVPRFGRAADEVVEVRSADLRASLFGVDVGRTGTERAAVRAIAERRRPRAELATGDEPFTVVLLADAPDEFGARWAVEASLDPAAPPRAVVRVAGLDVAEPRYADAAGLDAGQVVVDGTVDGGAELVLVPGGPPEVEQADARLRGNDLTVGGLSLADMEGRLELRAGRVESASVTGTVADSPFELRDVVLYLDPSRAHGTGALELPPDGGAGPVPTRLEATAFARNLRLDPRDLVPDDPAVARWTALHRWRCLVDLEGVELAVGLSAEGAPVARARGEVVPHDLYLHHSVPIRLRSARLEIEDLVADADGLRGTARLTEAYGDVAEQVLARTSARLVLDAESLTVEDLVGELGGGALNGYGPVNVPRQALVLSYGPRQGFFVGLRFQRVDVGRVIGDLFGSGVESRGVLSGWVQLTRHEDDRVTGIRGLGHLRLDEARLWSLPVVRELFATLGLDATATFDWIETDLALRDGRVELTLTEAHSPILRLVGGGFVDGDGTLDQRFDLHYSLVDQVPVVSKLFYWVQSQLVRVRVGGTIERPTVRLRSIVSALFGERERDRPVLPLPPTTELPPRF